MTTAKKNRFPAGWTEARVQRLAKFYDEQSEDEAAAELEAAFAADATIMSVPARLVPTVRRLIAKQRAKRSAA